VPLLIEIKDQDGAMGPNTDALEQAVAEDLAGYSGPVAVMSFNPACVAALAELRPTAARPDHLRLWGRALAADLARARPRPFARHPRFRDGVGASFISHDCERSRQPPRGRAEGPRRQGALLDDPLAAGGR
jgi:hypothetical protein